ncbi:MAG TPA: YfbM family protein [Terriglobales bacterium]|nr:YfbM family protein [Terriglobales bacterium]
MACRGVFFAITSDDAQRLITATSDAAVLTIVQEEIEQAWDEGHLQETDKAWDAMHRCLTDGTLRRNQGLYPLDHCVLNGRQLHKGSEYIVSFLAPNEVRDVALALQPISKDWFREKYFRIDPEDYGVPLVPFNEDDFEYTWAYFEEVREFYSKAAKEGRHVIFTVDQ